MNPDGIIRIKRIQLPFDKVRVEYQLMRYNDSAGKFVEALPTEVSQIAIDSFMIGYNPTPVIRIGPYQFRYLHNRPWCGDYIYIPDLPMSRLRVIVYKGTRWLDSIYRRLIITAYVWGLAKYDTGAVPTWRDLKIVGWITKKVKRDAN